MVKHVLNKKYTTSVKVPEITEEDKYKALKFRVGDKLTAKFFVGNYHKPFIRECTFLENINNKFLLVSLGDYKECITVRDIVC